MRYCPSCHRCFSDGVGFCLVDHTATFLVESLPLIIDGKYRLERLIAHGGMGSVYRAVHIQLERAVAIKILRAEFLSDPNIRERFIREARAAARLKHPNIVAVYDFGDLPSDSAYLVMELIEGRSLREEMRMQAARYGQMRPERAAAILGQICAGIEAAHRQGVIHRDLKPDNVMIEAQAGHPRAEQPFGWERVLVLDFGIAKLKDRDHVMRCITDEETVVGTPNYISPEQCAGQAVDARSDVYSLGVILYEMLTGHVPFAARNTAAVLLRHMQETPALPTRFRPDLSPGLEQVVMRALQKSPDRRFASAAQFSEALVAAANLNRSPVDSPVDLPVDLEETKIRRRVPAGPPEPPLPVEREPSLLIEHRPRTRVFATLLALLLATLGFGAYFAGVDLRAEAQSLKETVQATTQWLFARPEPVAVLARKGEEAKTDGFVDQASDPLAPAAVSSPTPEPASSPEAAPVEKSTSSPVREPKQVRAVYNEWAAAATLGDWNRHMRFYADRVDYFRDGTISRDRIERRKRAIFGGLTSYQLNFSDRPKIRLMGDEAEIVFDRNWKLCRGGKCNEGRAQGKVTFHYQDKEWRIISERQVIR